MKTKELNLSSLAESIDYRRTRGTLKKIFILCLILAILVQRAWEVGVLDTGIPK